MKNTTLIAEIGSNHDGSFERAKELIALAAEAGADAVKFQSFQAEKLVFRSHPAFAVLQKLQMPLSWHHPLKLFSESLGLDFLFTPFDIERLQLIDELDVKAIKIASGDLTHFELLKAAASLRRPIYLATGHAHLGEVERAVEVLDLGGAGEITLLHCTSLYPTPARAVNLRAMQKLQSAFNLPVGLSDHTLDEVAPLGAVALGASVIEKHFTDDSHRKGADHAHSLTPGLFSVMVKKIRILEEELGEGLKKPSPLEDKERVSARRALYASRDIPSGRLLTRDDFKIVRPAPQGSVCADAVDQVIGKKLLQSINEDQVITWNHLMS